MFNSSYTNNTVYTSLQNFKLKKRPVKSYCELNDELVEWIAEKSEQLLLNRNIAELKAGEELRKLFKEVHQQVYFRIYGRSYFLDFYLPDKKIAIEIDGRYHKYRRQEDVKRDSDFSTIGIRTIRIKASAILSGKFKETLLSSIASIRKKKAKNKCISNKSNELKEARRRVRVHDKMKHHASWI